MKLAKDIVSKMVELRWADKDAKCIRSGAYQIGDKPFVVEAVVRKIAMSWWCNIEISKQLDDGRIIDQEEFICGGVYGPIRWDAVIEGIRDLVSPYLY